MKRILLLLAACLCLCVSCKKEEAEKLDDRLVGTKWQCEDTVRRLIFGGTCYDVYEFISTTQVDHYTTRNGAVYSFHGTYLYELKYPNLIIHSFDSKMNLKIENFIIKNSREFIRILDDGSESDTFYGKYARQ